MFKRELFKPWLKRKLKINSVKFIFPTYSKKKYVNKKYKNKKYKNSVIVKRLTKYIKKNLFRGNVQKSVKKAIGGRVFTGKDKRVFSVYNFGKFLSKSRSFVLRKNYSNLSRPKSLYRGRGKLFKKRLFKRLLLSNGSIFESNIFGNNGLDNRKIESRINYLFQPFRIKLRVTKNLKKLLSFKKPYKVNKLNRYSSGLNKQNKKNKVSRKINKKINSWIQLQRKLRNKFKKNLNLFLFVNGRNNPFKFAKGKYLFKKKIFRTTYT